MPRRYRPGDVLFYVRANTKTFAKAIVRCRHAGGQFTVENDAGRRLVMPRARLRKFLPKRYVAQHPEARQ